jgi:hypothetical protein
MSVERLGVVIGGPETKQSAAETNAAIASVAQQAEKTSASIRKATQEAAAAQQAAAEAARSAAAKQAAAAKQIDDATRAAAAEQRRARDVAVEAAGARARAAMQVEAAEAKAANVQRRAAEQARLIAERQRREAAEYAADEGRKAAAAERASARIEAAERRRVLQHAEALQMDKALSASVSLSATTANKYTTALAALVGPLSSVSEGSARAVSSLAGMAAGGGVALAVVAGIELFSVAFDKLTEKSRTAKKATDDAIASLKQLAQQDVVGGKLSSDIGLAATDLAKQRAQLARLRSTGASSSINLGDESGGGGLAALLFGPAAQAKAKKDADDLARTIGEGQRQLSETVRAARDRDSADRTAALGTIIAADKATLAQRKQAARDLANIDAEISRKLSTSDGSKESLERIAALTQQAEGLRKAIEPTKTEINAAARALGAYAKAAIDVADARKAIAGTMARQEELTGRLVTTNDKWLDKQEAYTKAVMDANAARKAMAKTEANAITEQENQLALIGKTTTEVRTLTEQFVFLQKWSEGFSIKGAEAFAKNATALADVARQADITKRALDLIAAREGNINGVANANGTPGAFTYDKNNSKTIEAIRVATGAAQGFAQAFGDAGRTIGNVVGQVGNLASAVSKIGTKDGGAGNAFSITGALVGIGSELGLFGNQAQKARDDLAAFNRSIADFAIVARSPLDEQLRRNAQQASSLLGSSASFGSGADIASGATTLRIQAAAAATESLRNALLGAAERLEQVAGVTSDNEAIIREQIRAQEAATRAQKAAADGAAELADRERQLTAARARNSFTSDVTARSMTLRGDTRGAFIANRSQSTVDALESAWKLAEAGTITQGMFNDLRLVLEDEFTVALRDFDKATREAADATRRAAEEATQRTQDTLRLRYLEATGQTEALERARREIANTQELAGVTDEALRGQILYVQNLEREASAKANLNELILKTTTDQIDATKRFADTLRDTLAAQDQVRFGMGTAGQNFADFNANLDEDFARASGNPREAGRLAADRRRDDAIKNLERIYFNKDFSATSEEYKKALAKINAIHSAELASLVVSASAVSRITDVTSRSDVFNPQRDVVTRVAGGLTEVTAVAWLDIGYTQISILRRIEANTARGGSGGASNKSLGYDMDIDALRVGG